ncbi:MAG: ABC transporter substrate-binding protein [Solirubrobacterales bacterium]
MSVLALAACGEGGGAAVEGPVTVVASLPLTGPRAAEGTDAADGARLALERAGEEAGGMEVRLEVADDARGAAWSPAAVGANARAAAQDSSAAAYIGELDSQPTRASLPITNDAGIAQISPGAGAVDLTAPAEGYPDSPDRYRPSGEARFARVVPGDEAVAAAAAELAIELGLRRVTVDTGDDPYGRLVAEEFMEAAAAVGVETLAPGEGGEAGGEVIAQGAAVLRAGPGGGLALDSGAARHLVAAPLAPERLPDRAFRAEFERRFGRAPGPYAAYGYEAMALALQAIAAALGGDEGLRAGVVDAMLGAERPDSVLGPHSIDDDGETTLCPVQSYARRDGRLVPGEPICPR